MNSPGILNSGTAGTGMNEMSGKNNKGKHVKKTAHQRTTRSKLSLVLIAAGVLLMLYPLFTYVYARYEQNRLVAALEQRNMDVSEDNQAQGDEPGQADEQSSEVDNPVPEGAPPGEISASEEFNGALLEIPALDLKVAVLSGTTQAVLAKGPGWYEQSALPGQGNTCIAGHRTMHGAWFRNLDRLRADDRILLISEGRKFTYAVESVFPIANNDWSVIQPTSYPVLTLTTCHPPGSASQRLVVRAALTTERPGQYKDLKMSK